MQIKNKALFELELKAKVAHYVKHFPAYFWGNILINIVLVIGLVVFSSFVAMGMSSGQGDEGGQVAVGGIMAVIFIFSILRITARGFWKNLEIIREIRAGDYELGIEHHELDNAIEFIEDLPLNVAEVEQMRVSLSFGKLIHVLETSGVICFRDGMCDLDLVFRRDVGHVLEE